MIWQWLSNKRRLECAGPLSNPEAALTAGVPPIAACRSCIIANPLAGNRIPRVASDLTGILTSFNPFGQLVAGQFEGVQWVGCGASCQWTLLPPLWVEGHAWLIQLGSALRPGRSFCRTSLVRRVVDIAQATCPIPRHPRESGDPGIMGSRLRGHDEAARKATAKSMT